MFGEAKTHHVAVDHPGGDRVVAPVRAGGRLEIGAAGIEARRAREAKAKHHRAVVRLPGAEGAELETRVDHHRLGQLGLGHGRVAARRGIQQGDGRAVAKGEGEEWRRQHVFPQEKASRSMVQGAAGRPLTIIGRVAIKQTGRETVHVLPGHGGVDREDQGRTEAARCLAGHLDRAAHRCDHARELPAVLHPERDLFSPRDDRSRHHAIGRGFDLVVAGGQRPDVGFRLE